MEYKDKIIKHLAEFLWERGHLLKFIYNLKHHPNNNPIVIKLPLRLIIWEHTSEGSEFWGMLNLEWGRHMREGYLSLW